MKMKRLNITKEQFNRSNFLQKKYGKLEYVSESGKLFKTSKGKVLKFNEAGPHRVADDEDLDVPVTEQEELLCKYIPDEVEEFCHKNGLEVTCGCNPHNTGEEQHIEIYVGIPEEDDPTDPKYDNIEVNLEMLVNGIGDAENEGEKWGDASFQWISDEEIFGEIWPLEQNQVNEVRGWKLEDEDLTLVNSESDGDKLYIVKLWWGSGYMMDCYNAYAFAPDEALNYVVAYIEKNSPETLAAVDENAMENQDDPYFDETYEYVDATMEGASEPHYVYRENLTVAEYPKEHDYPMSKGIKRESRKRTRKVNESSVRKCTNELLDYAEAYPNFWETIAKACLSYMSEDEVEDMARMNDLLPDDDEYTDY